MHRPAAARFCALIPAYNVSRTIGMVVRKTLEHLPRVLVVDDGSRDDTARIARESGAEVVRLNANRGKGGALRCGFERLLREDWEGIVTLDGDMQHDPDDIPRLIRAREETGADIVIGARLAEVEKIPPARYYANMVGVFFISWASGQRLEDSQSGFRLYSVRALRSVSLRATQYDAETELLIKVGLRNMRIVSIPIQAIYYKDEECASHYRGFWDTFLIIMVFFKSLFWRRGMEL